MTRIWINLGLRDPGSGQKSAFVNFIGLYWFVLVCVFVVPSECSQSGKQFRLQLALAFPFMVFAANKQQQERKHNKQKQQASSNLVWMLLCELSNAAKVIALDQNLGVIELTCSPLSNEPNAPSQSVLFCRENALRNLSIILAIWACFCRQ